MIQFDIDMIYDKMVYDMMLWYADIMICGCDKWYDMIWYDMIYDYNCYHKIWYTIRYMIWCDVMWCGVVWCDVIWFDMIRYDTIRYDTARHDKTRYDMKWNDMKMCAECQRHKNCAFAFRNTLLPVRTEFIWVLMCLWIFNIKNIVLAYRKPIVDKHKALIPTETWYILCEVPVSNVPLNDHMLTCMALCEFHFYAHQFTCEPRVLRVVMLLAEWSKVQLILTLRRYEISSIILNFSNEPKNHNEVNYSVFYVKNITIAIYCHRNVNGKQAYQNCRHNSAP